MSLVAGAIGASIPVVAILSWPLHHWIKLKERQLDLSADRTAEKATLYAARTERLEQRVAVLERLLTDRSHQLGAEIEALRHRPVN